MSELLRLPGLIDVHTHCRQPGGEHKETLKTATKAAAAGGYTMIFDMPNTPIPTTSLEALQQKMNLAQGNIHVDVGFHFGAILASLADFEAVKDRVFAYKLYMSHTTGDLLVDNPDEQEVIFAKCPREKILMIHAEGDAFARALMLARKFRQRIHMCHLSLREEVKMVAQAQEAGLNISSEVTPHHLFLTSADEVALGAYASMRPPLGSQRDQDSLWLGLRTGVINMISSDHAPHTREEKESSKPPFGVPGLETTLPLLFTEVWEGRLSWDRFVQLTYYNPLNIFMLPMQIGTRVWVDTQGKHIIDSKKLHTKCGWSPFDGKKVGVAVRKVELRGQTIFEDGEIKNPAVGKVFTPQDYLTLNLP